ncbi:hypothetical protein ACEPAG_1263 [Sanghuangporus baumii]
MLLPRCARQSALNRFIQFPPYSRAFHATRIRWNIAQKYLEKVQRRAEEQGVSVDELRQKIKETARAPLPEAHVLREQAKKKLETDERIDGGSAKQNGRKDESPVKSLSEIMDIHKVLRTPHTPEQISALWTVFHASRSGGTGRGYLSASVPLNTYEKLLETGKQYPSFILPLIREARQAESSDSDQKEETTGYEFFFMQWAFHPAPRIPSSSILDAPLPDNVIPPAPVHPIATVLFTPLLEYKTHQTFATPHLVLTMYPDLAQTHQLVLLRGELTPSPAGNGKYLLSQQDAQLLALGLQRFYLAETRGEQEETVGNKERTELLRTFNENPSEFRWEDLLKYADPTS